MGKYASAGRQNPYAKDLPQVHMPGRKKGAPGVSSGSPHSYLNKYSNSEIRD